jgi:glycosyltransferase involved in cell wall biosynthesis
MRFACLMPTYGRRVSLLANSLACFESQTHQDRLLVIYDDLGTLQGCRINMPGVLVITTKHRAQSVGAKYNTMVDCLLDRGIAFDAVAVWDDDDIYMPDYLASHAQALQGDRWSKPSQIISAYHQPPALESGAGRFHGSLAVRRDTAIKIPWIETTRATFDQEHLAQLGKHAGAAGDPCQFAEPQYVYRWQTTGAGHCSGLMGREDWYERYQPDSREPIAELTPIFDSDTLRFFGCSV